MSGDSIPVLYVDNTSTFGGAINTLAHVVQELTSDGVAPVVVSGQGEATLRDLFPGATLYSWDMPVPWVHGPIFRFFLRIPLVEDRVLERLRGLYWICRHHLPEAMRLAWVGRRHSVRLVHLNNTATSQLSGLLAARLLGVPCVAHARGPQSASWAGRRYAALADVHVAISNVIADNLRSLGVPAERIVKVHDGIDLSEFRPGDPPAGLRNELGIPEDCPIFGLFGRLVPWKGVKEFVEAAAVVIETLPEARALVVGGPSDGEPRYGAAVRERARELGLQDRVVFTGFRTDVPDLMRLCDVVVHASVVPEPFGLVVVEALATGTPVVAADRGGPTEIVAPGDTGLLVEPRDTERMAEAVLRLLRDPAEARRMGVAGEKRMRSHFSARRSADGLLQVYARLLGPASGPARARW